ncbi:hypothetical protein KIH41_02455 [Litoribacter ruber]|uniref:hypothetical protein n=1 Tax=Litoribacter ruber TaxID=702568 RepID=UPI001BDB62F7|nr:hypothetical protein [Litoribacter ruber]MBT0810142.1 hypothetical protein [Litoribacter ruber]
MQTTLEKFKYTDFLNQLDEPLRSAVLSMDSRGIPLDTIGNEIAAQPTFGMSTKGSNNWDQSIFQKFLHELALLICDSPENELSKKLTSEANVTVLVVVSAASGIIGDKLGFAASMCTPFIVLAFATILKAGLNTFCSHFKPQGK